MRSNPFHIHTVTKSSIPPTWIVTEPRLSLSNRTPATIANIPLSLNHTSKPMRELSERKWMTSPPPTSLMPHTHSLTSTLQWETHWSASKKPSRWPTRHGPSWWPTIPKWPSSRVSLWNWTTQAGPSWPLASEGWQEASHRHAHEADSVRPHNPFLLTYRHQKKSWPLRLVHLLLVRVSKHSKEAQHHYPDLSTHSRHLLRAMFIQAHKVSLFNLILLIIYSVLYHTPKYIISHHIGIFTTHTLFFPFWHVHAPLHSLCSQ